MNRNLKHEQNTVNEVVSCEQEQQQEQEQEQEEEQEEELARI